MIKKILIVTSVCLIACTSKNQKPPTIASVKAIDEYHGQLIEDPYRNLENLEDTTVINWFRKQKRFTNNQLTRITEKKNLKKKIVEYQKITKPTYTSVKTAGAAENIFFYLKNKVSNNRKSLYVKEEITGKERLLFNPENFNLISDDAYIISYYQPNWSGTKVVISFTKDDEEISDMIVLDVKSGKLISEKLSNCWPSELGGVNWLPNDISFTYNYIPVTDNLQPGYLLNTTTLIYDTTTKTHQTIFSKKNNPDIDINKEDFPNVTFRSKNASYAFANVFGATNYSDHYYKPLDKLYDEQSKWKSLYKKEDLIKTFFVQGDEVFFLTAKNASNYKICKAPISDIYKSKTIVNEDKNAVITDMALTKKGLFYVKTKNGIAAKLYRWIDETEVEVPLDKQYGFISIDTQGTNGLHLWLQTEGWTSIMKRYTFNFKTHSIEEVNFESKPSDSILKNVVIKEIEVPSHDGTMVPLSIIYNKNLVKSEQRKPILINAYGAFKWSNSPYMYPYLLHWVSNGGIYATAHVRGGGEKGEQWYRGGYKKTKPNSWKDLIACTEYLKSMFGLENKVALWGASGGGITIGRAITERPELYDAAVIRVGLFNMLRSEFAPNGQNLAKEFGTVKDSLEFEYLYAMDAYQHIKKNTQYPAIYLTAGLNDTRVPAWQPAKFAARLQEVSNSDKPILLDIDFEGGHGFEASTDKKNEELANIMSFLFWQTDHPDYQPK